MNTKQAPFVIERAQAEDAAALLAFLKIVGGETENLSYGAEGISLDLAAEQDKLRSQAGSINNVLYLAKADGEIIGTASPSLAGSGIPWTPKYRRCIRHTSPRADRSFGKRGQRARGIFPRSSAHPVCTHTGAEP